MAQILIVDDDRELNKTLKKVIKRLGHNVTSAFTIKEGIERAHTGLFDVVILDVRLPDGSGLDALPIIQNTSSKPQVIIQTAYGDKNGAELAIQNGAWDYIKKPASINEMTLPLVRALEFREYRAGQQFVSLKRDGIIGSSKKLNGVLDQIAQASHSEANVLITGETGTGKELFAKTIHDNSPRAESPFVVVDCAAIPETLVESILFGYEKGAFTGADSASGGIVAEAHCGTMFLDEVGELPLSIQKSFLRVLQEHRFAPIGSKAEQSSNFRLIAATNRNLNFMVEQGMFRKDFLFRVNAFSLELPPLRERKEDVMDLIIHYNRKFCNQYNIKIKGVSPGFFEAMFLHDWPGNVRELVNIMERAVLVARDEPTLLHYHLPMEIRVKMAQSSFASDVETSTPELAAPSLDKASEDDYPTFEEYESMCSGYYFRTLLELVNGRKKDVCRVSGLSRTKVYRILKTLGI